MISFDDLTPDQMNALLKSGGSKDWHTLLQNYARVKKSYDENPFLKLIPEHLRNDTVPHDMAKDLADRVDFWYFCRTVVKDLEPIYGSGGLPAAAKVLKWLFPEVSDEVLCVILWAVEKSAEELLYAI